MMNQILIRLILSCGILLYEIQGSPVGTDAAESARRRKYVQEARVLSNDVLIKNSYLEQKENANPRNDPAECLGCMSGVYLVDYYIKINKTTPEIIRILEGLCVTLNYGNSTFCNEYANQYGPAVLTILKKTNGTAREICSIVHNGACGSLGDGWKVDVPGGKPPVVPRPAPKETTPKMKVLHITDTHYDPLYKQGTKDICDAWLCCREESELALKNESAAGKWGGWKCDIPERTLNSFLKHANSTHQKFDYIIWTGDIPPHSTWSQTKEDSISMLRSTVSKILKYFPTTPIFPALGNHEGSPPNLYPPPAIEKSNLTSWLYKELARQWSLMLPESTLKTIEYGAFYVAPVKPGLKIISLNTNFCYTSNWWLILNNADPADMLKWFIEELKKAEAEKIKVHVIGHIPPGSIDCLKVWEKNFYNIISRFENTVTAQFYGHTHTDEIEIYYDSETTERPVSIGYVGPSVTTFNSLNPGYRIYTIDGDHNTTSYDVADFETWIMDLDESNRRAEAIWKKLYSAKDSYNLKSLLPAEWNDLYERLKTDDELMDTYDRHYWKDSPKRPKCGDECRFDHLFDIRSGVLYGPPVINKH